jgi:hypothetical protein
MAAGAGLPRAGSASRGRRGLGHMHRGCPPPPEARIVLLGVAAAKLSETNSWAGRHRPGSRLRTRRGDRHTEAIAVGSPEDTVRRGVAHHRFAR